MSRRIIRGWVRQSSVGELADKLERHLAAPVKATGYAEPHSPEFDVIDAALAEPLTDEERKRLALSLATVLDRCSDGLIAGVYDETVAIAGRVGYLSVDLGLHVPGERFLRIARHLLLLSDLGRRPDPEGMFHVLRAVGRLEHAAVEKLQAGLFWSSFLTSPHQGIRTLAAQNFVRLDPVIEPKVAVQLLSSGANADLVVHAWLQAAGGGRRFAALMAGYPASLRDEVAAILVAIGEADVAAEIRAVMHERRSSAAGSAGRISADGLFGFLGGRLGAPEGVPQSYLVAHSLPRLADACA